MAFAFVERPDRARAIGGTGILRFVAVCLVALAIVGPETHPSLAQAREACPPPAGLPPLADPPVTAQQVEDGTGSLRDFALAARERSREHARRATTVEQGVYIACVVRQEDGPWRSGSTYIVSLTPDGRVFIHAKDMSLSGRLLDPLIYLEILSSLGVPPAELANLASPDPAARDRAFAAVFATLLQEPDAPFDATVPVAGLRPGIPRAFGYASVYVSPEFRSPIVLLAGFDIDASHLTEEVLDYGDPTITARDVVDRETLKAFVTQAGNYFLEIQGTGDPVAASRVRTALRDPNGPWRHGSVYLYVLDTVSNIITFHGAFPDDWEYRPLVPTVRDAVTGEFILPQVIAAAKSSPEGGFVEYYFDDPTDDTDSADIPKVGYAREFAGQLRRPDGHVVPIRFIVGSGIYLSDPNVAAARQDAVVESILPQVMRAMTAGTVDAVSDRIQQATSGAAAATGFNVGGAATLPDALRTHGQALGNGAFDPGHLLAGSSFNLPLNAADTGTTSPIGDLTLWGRGDYRNISGGNPQTVDYHGDVVSASLGVDTSLGTNLLAGMAVSWAQSAVDYTDSNAVTGDITTTLASFHPYLGWQAPGGMNVWAVAGTGSGEIEVDDGAGGSQASDLAQWMAAAGVTGSLLASDRLIDGGTTALRLKGETAFTWAEVDGAETLRSGRFRVSRHRLMLEGTHVQALASGATLSPSIEVGVRTDGGDGETGTRIEAGGGVRYADEATGLTLEARARTLLAPGGDYGEWGASGLVRVDPGAAGVGLALSVRPAWGRTDGGVQRLWETGLAGSAPAADQAGGRTHAEIAYGLAAPRDLGIVTPYAGVGLADTGTRSWRMGAQWQVAPAARVSLEGTRREAAMDEGSEHRLMLHGALRW
ncbi:MAG: autotransporter domain-containing protein [Rhodospirillales bacterium]|nr:autotransporter domain-containing protein [Rhodospirillales bacterium]